jgi:CheY-like chemotaxis protein
LTDLEMPTMDGVALVRAIRKMDPNIQVIASSGIGTAQGLDDKMAQLNQLGVQTLLTKPYGADKLLRALEQVLRKP